VHCAVHNSFLRQQSLHSVSSEHDCVKFSVMLGFSRKAASLTSSSGCCAETSESPRIAVRRTCCCGHRIRTTAGNTADCWNPINSQYVYGATVPSVPSTCIYLYGVVAFLLFRGFLVMIVRNDDNCDDEL